MLRERDGTSLLLQWSRLYLTMQGVPVQSLVWELKSHMPQSPPNQNINSRSNTVTNSIKTLKNNNNNNQEGNYPQPSERQ